ncbi:MAG TPA: hypothetical protein VJL87_02325 [Bdellovibrionota bacterium]|nr:hypothetical protein [Bdellovibrionota bacterium]
MKKKNKPTFAWGWLDKSGKVVNEAVFLKDIAEDLMVDTTWKKVVRVEIREVGRKKK